MSDNPLTPAKRSETLKDIVKLPEYSARFKEVLGERAAQFVSSLINVGATMKDVEPRSIIGSAMIAAALDLPIDKNLGFAWIVPYRNGDRKYAQFQMGYRGYVQLAQRSAQYNRMNALPINKEVFLGYDEVGEPKLDWDAYDPEAEVWGYFFGFTLLNGFTKKAVWSKEKVRVHAQKYSQAYRKKADIWVNEFDGMATKTVISNTLRKWGPLSVQLQTALSADQTVIPDMDALPTRVEDLSESPEFDHPDRPKVIDVDSTGTVSQPNPDEAAEAAAGLAPEKKKDEPKAKEQPKEKASETTAQVTKVEPTPAGVATPKQEKKPEPAKGELPLDAPAEKAKTVTPQAQIKQILTAENITFEDMVNTFAGKLFPSDKIPGSWEQIPLDKATYLVKNSKPIIAAIRLHIKKREDKAKS